MGAWGPGHFENDEAADFAVTISKAAWKAWSEPKEAEDLDLAMAVVAVELALVRQGAAPRIGKDKVLALRELVLSVYDAKIDGLEPTEEYRKERREAIARTFDDFLAALAEAD